MTVAEYSRNEEKHHLEALLSICGVQVKYKYAKKRTPLTAKVTYPLSLVSLCVVTKNFIPHVETASYMFLGPHQIKTCKSHTKGMTQKGDYLIRN